MSGQGSDEINEAIEDLLRVGLLPESRVSPTSSRGPSAR